MALMHSGYSIGEIVLGYAAGVVALAALGELLAAAIRIVLPVRATIHLISIKRWCSNDIACGQLMYLLTGQHAAAWKPGIIFWRRPVLPILQQTTPALIGMLSTVSTAVLDYPSRHKDVYLSLTATEVLGLQDDAKIWLERASNVTAEDTQAFRARDSLERLLERKLDALQADCEFRWRWVNQLAAAVVTLITSVLVARTMAGASWYITWIVTIYAAIGATVIDEAVRVIGARMIERA